MQEIEITIAPDGTMKIDTKGFKGPACLEELGGILRDLGELGIEARISSQQLKPEFYVQAQRSVTAHKQQ